MVKRTELEDRKHYCDSCRPAHKARWQIEAGPGMGEHEWQPIATIRLCNVCAEAYALPERA
jgi:hypothetical protein